MKVFSHHFVNQLIRGAEIVDLGVAISDKYDFFFYIFFSKNFRDYSESFCSLFTYLCVAWIQFTSKLRKHDV